MPSAALTQTTADGDGALINLPPGATTLTATYVETGLVFSSKDILIRAGAMTSVIVSPTP